jgi:hypothetical protein
MSNAKFCEIPCCQIARPIMTKPVFAQALDEPVLTCTENGIGIY